MRVINNTDEKIVIEPGDSVKLSGETKTQRLMSQRVRKFYVGGKDGE